MRLPSVLHSFYVRTALIFIVLVVVVLLAQGVMVSRLVAEGAGPFAPGSPNESAAAIAVTLARELTSAPEQPLKPLLLRASDGLSRDAYVMLRDGRLAGRTDDPLNPDVHRYTEALLAGTPVHRDAAARPTGPVVSSPIHVDGQLLGLVILPAPPLGGALADLGRVLSLPGTSLLVLGALLAALVTFAPARRRLRRLERAAERLGAGDLTARAVDDGRDEIARVSAAFNRMAAELAARTDALRASDALRRQMVADVSHELKTPLTAVTSYLETLAMPEVHLTSEARARLLATARHEAGRLRRIVADLLDLATEENAVGELRVRLFDVGRLFEHVVGRHEADARSRGVRLLTRVADGGDQIAADADRLEQVVDNLVVNALRFTPAGGTIELTAEPTARGQRLSVVDSGHGIPPEHLAHIFERFYKVDAARTSGAGGSGLGLSIVHAIVARHGGTITVNSRPGRTEFVIDLPQRGVDTVPT